MSPFGVPITCATCGGALGLVNGRSNGLLSVAILECPACEREWEMVPA